MASISTVSLFLCACGGAGNSTPADQSAEEGTTPEPEATLLQTNSSDQSTPAETPSEGPSEASPPVADTPEAAESSGTITVDITPLRTREGIIYGAEARDQASGTLLATAKQVAMSGDMLVVEETQYSPSGDVVYEGKLFFSAGNELVNEERTSGQKRWNVFQTWISDSPGF